jgi:hypothetical protein
VIRPGRAGHGGFGLRAGCVQHQHIDRPQTGGNRGNQPAHLLLIGDIGAEGLGQAGLGTDAAGDVTGPLIAGQGVDRDGQPVAGQTSRDGSAEAARTARHQSDPILRYRHGTIIAPPGRSAFRAG